VGKTNILEAVFALATGKSFRAGRDSEMVKIREEVGRITGVVEDTKLELVVTTGTVNGEKAPVKKYLVNGVSRRQIDFIGHLKAVLFWPEDLELVTDSPSLRRRYFDSVLVQVDREYRRHLLSYEKGVRQRNKVLERINEGAATRSQLLFWNQLIIKSGSYITDKRMEYINFVNNTAIPGVSYQLVYDKSVISETRLEQYKDEEVAAKSTLVGPHRDDIEFQMSNAQLQMSNKEEKNFVSLNAYGSRGEQRIAVVWLKLAELSYIQTQTNDRPVLLLDDIFSELDEEHQKLILDLTEKYQTIITSAHVETEELVKAHSKIKPVIVRLPYDSS